MPSLPRKLTSSATDSRSTCDRDYIQRRIRSRPIGRPEDPVGPAVDGISLRISRNKGDASIQPRSVMHRAASQYRHHRLYGTEWVLPGTPVAITSVLLVAFLPLQRPTDAFYGALRQFLKADLPS